MKCYAMHPEKFGEQRLVISDIDIVTEELTNSEPGEKWIIEVVEMTQEQMDALPEFQGW